jgi:hypothetical protein
MMIKPGMVCPVMTRSVVIPSMGWDGKTIYDVKVINVECKMKQCPFYEHNDAAVHDEPYCSFGVKK